MSQRYQLPCPSCSSVLQVATTQAGETLVCSCGEELVVPTLRELRQLDTVEDENGRGKTSGWNPLRGALFVSGVMLLAIAGIGHWRVDSLRQDLDTTQPEFREMTFDVQTLTPMRAWEAWVHFREQSLQYRDTPEFVENRRKHRELTAYLYAFWAAAGIGLILVGVSICVGRQPRA